MSVLGPAVAGRWYPAHRAELISLVDGLLSAADARSASPRGGSLAVIAPHAGLAYSGAVAAGAIRAIAGAGVDRLVVIGPSHHFAFAGAAVPSAAAAYRTPLGDLPIDADAVALLRRCHVVQASDRFFEPEHALEAELPFVQRSFPSPPAIVPVLCGPSLTEADAAQVAEAIAPLMDARTRLVVSSDFTHYGPRFDYVPFTDDLPARLEALDRGAIRAIEAGDGAAFAGYVEATGATICGRRAIDVLLRLDVGRRGGRLAEYDTSGRITASWDHSVSYASIGFP